MKNKNLYMFFLSLIFTGFAFASEVKVVNLEPKSVFAIQKRGLCYRRVALSAWGRLAGLFSLFDFRDLPAEKIGRYLDDPTDVSSLVRYEACVLDNESLPFGGCSKTIAGGRHLMLTHVGPYEMLPAVYKMLFESAAKLGLSARSTGCFDIYVKGPSDVGGCLDEMETRCYLPVE
ncbi:GyrI-like domain-containing protein [bacterium]|jgi:DNA gyrase inhibitor GyrI|nr:GyrI-like domain-containing protein [bacterium]